MALKYGTTEIKDLKYSNGSTTTPINVLKYGDNIIWARPYTLTLSPSTGVNSIIVNRTSAGDPAFSTGTLSNGATITHGDVLAVSATASTDYDLNSYITSYTVSGNLDISVTACNMIWTDINMMNINNETPYSSGGLGTFTVTYPNGAVYTNQYNEPLTTKFRSDKQIILSDISTETGFKLVNVTQNNTAITSSNGIYTCASNGQAICINYKPLTWACMISSGTGVANVTVTRTSSPHGGASIGTIYNGTTIYYGDTLTVSATASAGYALNNYTSSITVTGSTTINITAYSNPYVLSTVVSGTTSQAAIEILGPNNEGDGVYVASTELNIGTGATNISINYINANSSYSSYSYAASTGIITIILAQINAPRTTLKATLHYTTCSTAYKAPTISFSDTYYSGYASAEYTITNPNSSPAKTLYLYATCYADWTDSASQNAVKAFTALAGGRSVLVRVLGPNIETSSCNLSGYGCTAYFSVTQDSTGRVSDNASV